MRKEIALKNGETISYLEEGTSDKVIILLHGNLSTSLNFKNLVTELSKDFRVIAPDMRGSGKSTYYRRLTKIQDLSDDLLFFMRSLKIPSASILGWEFGGAIAMTFASTHWSMVESLILLSSVPHSGIARFKMNEKGVEMFGDVYSSFNEFEKDLKFVKPLVEALKNKDKKLLKEELNKLNYSISDDEVMDEILRQRNIVDNIWILANYNMSHQHNFYSPGTNTINNIHVPILHLWGEEDKFIAEYMVLQNVYALKDLSKYIKYEKSGHNLMEDNLSKLVKDINEFISK